MPTARLERATYRLQGIKALHLNHRGSLQDLRGQLEYIILRVESALDTTLDVFRCYEDDWAPTAEDLRDLLHYWCEYR